MLYLCVAVFAFLNIISVSPVFIFSRAYPFFCLCQFSCKKKLEAKIDLLAKDVRATTTLGLHAVLVKGPILQYAFFYQITLSSMFRNGGWTLRLRGKRQDRKTIWLPASGKIRLVCSRVRTFFLSGVGVCLRLI